ncbi:unnamed protein product [Brassicogethes aeneus]|uniref:tRNA/rRNA methyltransferase SpoU type domain-containing protein n=1 Tax=Brassicogethes aeneus TaxID=1431903 RepID=A0A9P0FIR9_BRAAE|nr:unnamed protein product [Brassicogethes aeneus]
MASLIPNALHKVLHQQVRFLPRWSHRRPINVLSPEQEEKEFEEKHEQKFEEVYTTSRDKVERVEKEVKFQVKARKNVAPFTISSKQKKPVVTDVLETVIDSEGNLVYTKMKDNDQRVGTILTKLKSKKEKMNPEKILLEGKRIIKDALLGGCKLEYILFSRMSDVEYLKPYIPKLGSKLYKMPYKEMQLWSELTTNPGIMGIFHTPKVETFKSPNSLPLIVICDNVRDPSNLGAILRACSGVGCEKVILTKGCVNLWDSKVLRSSSGAHFRLQIHQRLEWEKIKGLLGENAGLFVADNNLEATQISIPLLPYYGIKFDRTKHNVVIVGGESEGISSDCYKTVQEYQGVRVNIPLSNNVESLNNGMAVGIIVFEIKRQLLLNNT